MYSINMLEKNNYLTEVVETGKRLRLIFAVSTNNSNNNKNRLSRITIK